MPEPLVLGLDETWRRPGLSLSGSTPQGHYPYIGTSWGDSTLAAQGFSSSAEAITFYDNALGGAPMLRIFQGVGAGMGSWTSGDLGYIMNNTNATVHYSFKDWSESAINTWLNAKPDDGRVAFVSFQHEPENTNKTTWTSLTAREEYRWRHSRLVDLRNATGRTDIKIGPTFMGSYTLRAKPWWETFYIGPPIPGYTPVDHISYNEQDFIGWDPYNWAWDSNPPFYADPTAILDAAAPGSIFNVGRVTGLPLGIGEFGSPRLNSALGGTDNDGTGLATWTSDYIDACVQYGIDEGGGDVNFAFVNYWSAGAGQPFDSSIHDEPLTLATLADYSAVCRAHYGITGV